MSVKLIPTLVSFLLVAACTPIVSPVGESGAPPPDDTPAPAHQTMPAEATQILSPDTAWTAILEDGGLRLVADSGIEQAVFPAGSTITSANWSPDSARLLALQTNLVAAVPAGTGYDIVGPLTIWALSMDERTPKQLAALPESVEYTSQLQWGTWSPDGRHVTFWSGILSASALADGLFLSVLDSDSGEIVSLDSYSLYTPAYHAWSPDGSRLAVTLGGGRDVWRNKSLAIFHVTSGTVTPVDSAAELIPGRVAWSPDGDLIAFAANPADTSDLPAIDAGRIYLLDVASGETRRLNETDSFQDALVWDANGDKLYFVQRVDDRLQLMTADPITGETAPVEGAAEPLPDLAGYYGLFDWDNLLQQVP